MKIARVLTLFVFLIVLVPAAQAQTGGDESPAGQSTSSGGSITLNTPVTITLSGTTPVVLDFKAVAGETISVSARSLEADDEIDPVLSVLDAQGMIVADNDDHRTSRTDLAPRDSLIADLVLDDAGSYTIQVIAFNDNAAGDVEVLVTDGSASIPSDTPADTPAAEDETIEGDVPDDDAYTHDFEAAEGETLTITVRATDNQLDPKVSILDESGAVLEENDDHTSGDADLGPYDSQIAGFSVPASGSYTIEITAFGGVGGSFELTIDRSGSSQQNPPDDPTPVASGDVEVVEDSIEAYDIFTHTFDAEAGDVYVITVQATSDDFDPQVSLYFDDDYLVDNDDYGSTDADMELTDAQLYNFIMPESGEYELDVQGYQDSAGDFRLTIERVATGAPTGVPDEQFELGTVESGQTFSYSFDAEAGDYVTISARGLSYNFDAFIALLNEDGTVLINNDDHGGGTAQLAYYDSQIPNYLIEESGTYTVEVSGLTDEGGTFGLTVGILR